MTFREITEQQLMLVNWIEKNLKPIKRIEQGYSSLFLTNIAKRHLGDWVTHEEFKQAMIRCGYWADTSHCDEYYTKWRFNVSSASVRKTMAKR